MDSYSIINAIETIEKHPSMRKIRGHMHPNSIFSFDYFTKEGVVREIILLDECRSSKEKLTSVKKTKGNKRFA